MLGKMFGISCNGSVASTTPDRRVIVMECDRSSALGGARVVWAVISLMSPWNGFRGAWTGTMSTLGPGQMYGDGQRVEIHVHSLCAAPEDANALLHARLSGGY